MIEGSGAGFGAGSVLVTNGSRCKYIWILRIWICNISGISTVPFDAISAFFSCPVSGLLSEFLFGIVAKQSTPWEGFDLPNPDHNN
jgi:hypothetical protein